MIIQEQNRKKSKKLSTGRGRMWLVLTKKFITTRDERSTITKVIKKKNWKNDHKSRPGQ